MAVSDKQPVSVECLVVALGRWSGPQQHATLFNSLYVETNSLIFQKKGE